MMRKVTGEVLLETFVNRVFDNDYSALLEKLAHLEAKIAILETENERLRCTQGTYKFDMGGRSVIMKTGTGTNCAFEWNEYYD